MPVHGSDPKNSVTIPVLLGLLALGGGFVGLTALVMPAAAGFLVVLFGFFFLGVFQYLLWGWWMPKQTPDDDQQD